MFENNRHSCKLCIRFNNKTFQKSIKAITKYIKYGKKGYMKSYCDVKEKIKEWNDFTVYDVIKDIKDYTDAEKQLKILKLMVCRGKLSCKYRFGNPIYMLIKGEGEKCPYLEINQKENKEEYENCNNEEWVGYTRPEVENSEERVESKINDLFSHSWQKEIHGQYIKSAGWKFEVRSKVIERDEGRCTEKGCEKAGEAVHHKDYLHWDTYDIKEFIKKGLKVNAIELIRDNDKSNLIKLQFLCPSCHRKKHENKIENGNGQKMVEDFMIKQKTMEMT